MKSSLKVIILSSAALLSSVVWIWTSTRCHPTGKMMQDSPFASSLPVLAKYQLQFGWRRLWPFGLDQLCLLATTPDGKALEMPKDFQTILRHEHVSVSSSENALALAKTYVALTSPYKVFVISNLGMIPGIDRNPLPRDFSFTISEAAVQSTVHGYQVNLFAWNELGGRIEEWTIVISKEGMIDPHVQELASGVGNAKGFL